MVATSDGKSHDGSSLINFSIAPPQAVTDSIVGLSHDAGGMFVVDGIQRYPHLTVFMARFDVEMVPDVVELIAKSSLGAYRVQLDHVGYQVTRNNYYEVAYAKTQELVELQTEVSGIVSGLRKRGDTNELYFVHGDERQMRNARETGYDLIGPDFRPHITVTKFGDLVPRRLPTAAEPLSFHSRGIQLYTADPLGAATQLLWRNDRTD